MTDLYTYENGIFGLSPCAPIVKYDKFDNLEFKAALCIDILPSGPLNKYFDFEAVNEEEHYMLFNEADGDGENDEESLEHVLVDENSQFRRFLNQSFQDMIDNEEYPYNSFEIIDIRLFSATARLY